MGNQAPQQYTPVAMAAADKNRPVLPVAFFDSEGNSITLDAGDDLLTGYEAVEGRENVAATDSVREGIEKVEGKANAPGDAVGAGYTIGLVAEEALADTDTLLEMIGKLEKRVADIEAAP